MNNKKYLHLVGNDINIFCGKAGNGIDDKITNNPLNSTHIYNALCVLFNKTPIPQKKKTGQIYDDKIFYKHDDITALLENTYFKISDLSGNGKFDISKSGSHTNNTVKKENSRPTNNVQLTWYDIKQYINDVDIYNRFRSDLSEKFNINIDDSLQNCMGEFHKLSINCNVKKDRYIYVFEKNSIYDEFLIKLSDVYSGLINDIKQDPLVETHDISWDYYSINRNVFYEEIKSYGFIEFDNVSDFINHIREHSIEMKLYDKQYNIYQYDNDITTWINSWKTQIVNILTKNQIHVLTKDIANIYNACKKTTLRGFESSKKFKIELKIILDEEMRYKLNNGLGYCTIGDGGLLKCVDYKQMTFHEMYGFVNLKNIDSDVFWTKLRN